MSPFYRFAARGAIILFLKAVSRQKVTRTENIVKILKSGTLKVIYYQIWEC